MSLKEKINADNTSVFFDTDEFAETLSFQGLAESGTIFVVGIVNVLAHNSTANAEDQMNPGTSTMAVIHVSAHQFTAPPSVYDEVIQGTKKWMVLDVLQEFGIYKLVCSSERRARRR